jgi:glycosyltransferase involved in cell wall biosynthesis
MSSLAKKPVVAQAVENLRIGGLEKNVVNIAMALNKSKYKVIVYCLASGGTLADKLKREGINVKILNLKSYHNPINIIKLAHIFKKDNIKILHTHGYFASSFARLSAILAQVPIRLTTITSVYYENKLKHFLIEKLLSFFTDRIVCVSSIVKDFIKEKESIAEKKLFLLYNGINIKKPKYLDELCYRWHIYPGDKVIGTVARLEPAKGIEFLIKAAREILKQFYKVKFLIVGDGSQRDFLERLTKELNLDEKVIFTGYMPEPQDVIDLMDVFVMPSTFREGCSLAISEAMAHSKPIVATCVGGNPEQVIDGLNGILVEPKDENCLAQAILILLKDKNLCERMKKESKKIFERKFNIEKTIKILESLYDRLLKEKKVVF